MKKKKEKLMISKRGLIVYALWFSLGNIGAYLIYGKEYLWLLNLLVMSLIGWDLIMFTLSGESMGSGE